MTLRDLLYKILISFRVGLAQTSNFTRAEPNINVQKLLVLLIALG